MIGTLVRACRCASSWWDIDLTFDVGVHHGVTFNFGSTKVCELAILETCFSYDKDLLWIAATNYVHPPVGVRRPTWFLDILGNSSYPIFTKFGMQVYWVNSLYGIAFGDDSSIAN